MMIFGTIRGDPMLLASEREMGLLCDGLQRLLSSQETMCALSAETSGDPAPYDTFFEGLRIEKSRDPPELVLVDGWLRLSASPDRLAAMFKRIQGLKDGDHRHWYAQPLSLIVEADDRRAGAEADD